MQKVFNISLPRTGTQSVSKFLTSAGYNSMHWIGNYTNIEDQIKEGFTIDDLFRVVSKFDDKFDAFNDTPYNILHKHYGKKYQDAKFILVTRRLDDWLESKENFNKKRIEKMTPMQKIFYSGYGSNNVENLEYSYQVSRKQLTNIYNNHIDSCLSFFSKSDNFIHVGLNDIKFSEKMNKFMETKTQIPIINADFLKNTK